MVTKIFHAFALIWCFGVKASWAVLHEPVNNVFDLKRIKSNINLVEKKLGKAQSDYLIFQKKEKQLTQEISQLSTQYAAQKSALESLNMGLKNYQAELAFFLKNDHRQESFLELAKRRSELDRGNRELRQLKIKIESTLQLLDEKNASLWKVSQAMKNRYTMLTENEKRKNDLLTQYLDMMEKKPLVVTDHNKIVVRPEFLQTEITLNYPFPGGILGQNMKSSGRGHKFTLAQGQKFNPVKKGMVIHVGPLGALGNVLIIDHGEELRSVYLGNFRALRNKNDQVQLNEHIGVGEMTTQEIYYEIRKSDKTISKIKWDEQVNL